MAPGCAPFSISRQTQRFSGDSAINKPTNLKYTKTDEWFDPATGALGLTDYAQSQLSDIVFVEVQLEAGEALEAGKAVASVESVKASAGIYSPVGGKVTEVNKALRAPNS